ncbi:hypothetical protein AB835_10560 [Candidatus Endobugula sertula]|uniref:Lipopolysaccharide assembly protein A domain-containing protein n=1 Tax=Candidatus Endobugula sertula TaxID=62101 RepID=A0A1D2QNE3_9GAMM|nr:hypothetical protein AB835_10560 [Candidatus Endobugula sertula]
MVRWIIRLFLLVLFLLAVAIGITLAYENNTLVPIVLLGYSLPKFSVGLWVVIALFFGAIIGLLLSGLLVLLSRHSHYNKDRKIEHLQKEINQLRISGIKG